jgi:multidrug efflux pump subunit AcrB
MILLFLGSVRSTLIIVTSIPLAVLAAIATLYVFGETLNVMTLGGLALAVGHARRRSDRHHREHQLAPRTGQGRDRSITDGAAQIVVPAFVSMLCICIVFVPMFFLPGVAGYLFVPMALAVVFSMIASFILSRTLVPTMAMYLLKPHEPHAVHTGISAFFVGIQRGFEGRFERLRAGYIGLLRLALPDAAVRHRLSPCHGRFVRAAAVPGQQFLPSVDSGQILMHVRVPMGSRIEETSAGSTASALPSAKSSRLPN